MARIAFEPVGGKVDLTIKSKTLHRVNYDISKFVREDLRNVNRRRYYPSFTGDRAFAIGNT
jgi:hypothetical protein